MPPPPLLPPPCDTAVVAPQEIQDPPAPVAPMAEQQRAAWDAASPPAPAGDPSASAVAGLPPPAAPGAVVGAAAPAQPVGAGDHPLTGIVRPTINDCLLGRGGGTNHHPVSFFSSVTFLPKFA